MECEIFGTIHEEAIDSYESEKVHDLTSNNLEDMENNVEKIMQWIEMWKLNKNV